MIRLSRKFIKRSVIGLALLAPIVYLFGSQFFYLNGVHGSMEVIGEGDYLSDVVTYDAFNYFEPRESYTSYGVSLTNNNGILDINGVASSVPAYGQYAIGVLFTLPRDGSKFLFDFPSVEGFSFGLSGYAMNTSSFLWYYNNPTSWSGYPYLYIPAVDTSVDIDSFYMNIWNLTELFGRGNEPTIDEFHAMFPKKRYPSGSNHLEYREYTPWPETPTPQSNAYFLFGQFFYSDNFLTDWGRDAISENPHGFAPFGVLLKTIDDNVLHLSNEQIGLMGYGYFYYCAHVLIFAFMFECATFFIAWCSSIFNKFGGKDNGD